MSTPRGTVEVLTILEHPNADALEPAQVGLYRAVVARGSIGPVTPPSTSRSRPCFRSGWSRSFDISAEIDGRVRWLDSAELSELLDGQLPLVPRRYEGPYDIDRVLEVVTGRETVSGRGPHLREGVVIRPAVARYSPVTGGRAIAKAVSPACLTRKGGTEYE